MLTYNPTSWIVHEFDGPLGHVRVRRAGSQYVVEEEGIQVPHLGMQWYFHGGFVDAHAAMVGAAYSAGLTKEYGDEPDPTDPTWIVQFGKRAHED